MMTKWIAWILFLLPSVAGAAPFTVSLQGLISMVIYVIIIGLVFWLLFWLIQYTGIPEPFAKIIKVVLAVVAVLLLINLLLGLLGNAPVVFG